MDAIQRRSRRLALLVAALASIPITNANAAAPEVLDAQSAEDLRCYVTLTMIDSVAAMGSGLLEKEMPDLFAHVQSGIVYYGGRISTRIQPTALDGAIRAAEAADKENPKKRAERCIAKFREELRVVHTAAMNYLNSERPESAR